MRSLNTGFEEMASLVADFDFDIFGVTETWLHPDSPFQNYKIPGYTILRCDRANSVGGGVALYVKEDIVHEQYTLPDDTASGIECVCAILKLKGVKIGLCVIYRPPHL